MGAADEDVRGRELAASGPTCVGCVLGMPADRDRRRAEISDFDITPAERIGLERARLVAVQPLGFVEDEAEWPDESELADCEVVEYAGVRALLRICPHFAESEDLARGVPRQDLSLPSPSWSSG